MFLPLSPLVIPLLTAIACLFARASRPTQHLVAILGAFVGALACGALFLEVWSTGRIVVSMSDWPAPFGIVVVVDTLSAVLTSTTALVHLAITSHGLASADEDRRRSDFWPLVNTLVMGVQGAFLTGDLFNLYVWFEVLLISSFVLVALGNSRLQIEAAAKYVVLNLLSSGAFLIGIALIYGTTGTLNLADLSESVRGPDAPRLLASISVLFAIGYGIKAAMVPFSGWLPSAYGSPPATLAALLAGLLTKVGVYAFLRVGTLLFLDNVPGFESAILLCALITLVVGALGAFAQVKLRGVIVHTVVFAVGFMLLGIGTGTRDGLAAAIFYLVSDMVVVTTLLLLGGEVERITGRRDLAGMGGLYRSHPALALGFLVVALSVAGFPPFVGFWGKVALFEAAVSHGDWSGMLVALFGSAIVLSSVGQAWSLGLWSSAEHTAADPRMEPGRVLPLVGLVGLILAFSLWPAPLFEVAQRAATELTDLEGYREAVLP